MCFGLFGGGSNSAAAQAAQQQAEIRAREKKRQADILAGRGAIDEAFTQFGDDYFSDFQDTYTSTLLPDLDRQFGDAKAKLIAALAGRGVLESTVGAQALGDVDRKDTEARAQIGNQAVDAANQLRGTVENTKGDLYALNEASADPALANTRATARAAAIQAPQAITPLGEVFASSLEPFVAAGSAFTNRAGPAYRSPYAYRSRSGSGRVVG